MQEIIEIGRGRTATTVYELADIAISAQRRTRSSHDVSTKWQIDAYKFDIPLLTHPSDSVVDPDFVETFNDCGGLGVLNAEGLWGRFADPRPHLKELAQRASNDPRDAQKLLQKLHMAPIDTQILTRVVSQLRERVSVVAVRVSPQNAQTIAPVVAKAGADVLFMQGTIVSAEHVSSQSATPMDMQRFITEFDIPVIAGGVSDYRTALFLMRSGVAGVIVGSGAAGSSQATGAVLGISVPLATAIVDAAAARRDYLDETGGRYVHIIADGRVDTSGDLAKCIACGADAVMLGPVLSQAKTAAASGWFWPSSAAHPSLPRGGVFRDYDYAVSVQEILFGPSCDTSGSLNLVGGLRRAMAKTGYTDMKEFQKVQLTVSSRG